MEDHSHELSDSLKSDLMGLVGGAAIGSTLTSDGSKAILKMINRFTDQTYPIGELFMLHANQPLATGKETISYVPLYPRTPSDLVPNSKWRGFLADLMLPLGSMDLENSLADPEVIKTYPEEAAKALKANFTPYMKEHLQRELQGIVPHDKFSKYPEVINKLKSITSNTELSSVLDTVTDSELPTKGNVSKHLIRVPRNNTLTMAHEVGHVMEKIEREKSLSTGSPLWQKIKKGLNEVYHEAGAMNLMYSKLTPDFIRNNLQSFVKGQTNPVLNTIATSLVNSLGTPLTAAVAPFTMSQTVRDLVSDLDSSGNTKKVMDWVGDNATTVSALASAPLLIHEIATTAPGYKATVDFWKEFNKGFDGALKDSPLLRESANLIGKKKPWLEGLKFIGQNALRFVPALAPVVATAISSHINKSRKEEDTL